MERFKQRAIDKHSKFANSKSYYNDGTQKWGEDSKYGYELPLPYTEAEIVEFERKNDLTLPADFREYLLKVSREVYCYSYPKRVGLWVDKSESLVGPDIDYVNEETMSDSELEIPGVTMDDNDESTYKSVSGGMMTIGEGGCTYSHMIMVKGSQIGTVWYNDGNGPLVMREYKTFTDYLSANLR
jgi:hypothetical protein